jgi:2-amino-4-hydroxy-6-hydroxymethyldihydropteridine diphosphokinase
VKTIYLSVGSNLGDREENLARAVGALSQRGARVVRQSSLYETEPVDLHEQPWFLNCVVEAETELMPRQLLQALLGIEQEMGRRRRVPRGPRLIDMDILFFGSSIIRMPDLEIPHPRLAQRRFVLVPLSELSPNLRHPVLNKTVAELLAETADRSQVRNWPVAR